MRMLSEIGERTSELTKGRLCQQGLNVCCWDPEGVFVTPVHVWVVGSEHEVNRGKMLPSNLIKGACCDE